MIKTPPWPKILGYKPIDLGLERVQELLARLGNPEQQLPPVVHVAGTNGKGSSIAFLRAILETAGYKVHAYTSPHLVSFNERIVLAGEPIEDEMLLEVLRECEAVVGDIPVTFFEGTTVAAFLAFSRVEADIVLLETGMGGRLDATNIIDQPALTVITPISMDHMDYLGDSLTKIAAEKAAIMKPGVPCVVAAQEEVAWGVISKEAEAKNVPLHREGFEWEVDATFTPNLAGEFQLQNATVAVECARQLKGFNISEENIIRGVSQAHWPARLQQITKGPLVDLLDKGSELWLDGGHNEAAAQMLAEQARQWKDKPLYIIGAMLNNRDATAFFSPLASYITAGYGIAIPNEEGSKSAEEIAAEMQSTDVKTQPATSLRAAVQAISEANTQPVRILICGSLYLAGVVLEDHK